MPQLAPGSSTRISFGVCRAASRRANVALCSGFRWRGHVWRVENVIDLGGGQTWRGTR